MIAPLHHEGPKLRFDAVTEIELACMRQAERLCRSNAAQYRRYGCDEFADAWEAKGERHRRAHDRRASLAMPLPPSGWVVS
ncbi:hypothetical protein [Acidomonas methanolica]|uniref:Uncharacterized protein n=1 Tax=Acidomonas methanolica NBRC 104435 TaxID=1231351 RepID=A0A023D7W0_ACIMT|nr:hypothetical protein [Acidomonas methanolica]TCS23826.1 hypothetical protein EDC31_12744 [Acidomonas methanolica]GAJ29830.1 hypothetical protein Amme_083_005 [Acidomonas methanolica NBRC 104435]GBQ52919.1 hypothetical protein AA0498_1833 [Acidomonas methanolica]GEL00179.1 hypothetical protein AME01nite_26770 [Acidomonas methanolica NBRC 104435]